MFLLLILVLRFKETPTLVTLGPLFTVLLLLEVDVVVAKGDRAYKFVLHNQECVVHGREMMMCCINLCVEC